MAHSLSVELWRGLEERALEARVSVVVRGDGDAQQLVRVRLKLRPRGARTHTAPWQRTWVQRRGVQCVSVKGAEL